MRISDWSSDVCSSDLFVARAEGEASAEHRRATALENLVFNAAGHCIVTTGAMKEKVVGYGVPEERVSVIPNYVDTMLFRPLEGQEGGKAQIGSASCRERVWQYV